ncbi:MAG TPA: hypothetical protein VHB48_01505 [Chitinophagaceae bacterium]|nr:hypothetical protein [Chitinophagaceae bacterium]
MQNKLLMTRKPVIALLALAACICTLFAACQKEYSLEVNQNLAAEGTLLDTTTGECMKDSVVGTFYGGVEPGRDTAYILVNVTVTNPGTYSIFTNTQNGFYFSDSGYFSTTGLNVIKLKPVGVPIIPGATDFTVTFDSTVCGFTVYVQDSTGTGVGGGGITDPNQSDTAWKFTGPSGTYHGSIDTAFTKTDSLGAFTLNIIGYNATSDSAWAVQVYFSGGQVATGSYSSTSSSAMGFIKASTGSVIYEADPTTTGANTIVNIVSWDAANSIVTGTFNGTAKDSSGNIVSITNGTFTAKVHQ